MAKKVDASEMSKMNKKEILHLIKNGGIISRSDLVSISGLTPPTISRIVELLINEDKLVEYVGIGESSGGRPPVLLQFTGKKNYVIGIDIGATLIRGVLSDLNANFLMEIHVPTEMSKGLEAVMAQVVNLINKLLNRKDLNRSNVRGVGIAIAGLVNKTNGVVEVSPDFGWKNVDIKAYLKPHISLPLVYDNSTRLMAVGERSYGEGRKYDNLIMINLGYGIAAGIIMDGKPLMGTAGFAGEFGHIIVDRKSNVLCKCGAIGCLEALASGRRIAQLAQDEVAGETQTSILSELCGGDISKIDAKLVAQAAQKGDKAALKIFREITGYLGIAIGSLVNLLNPQIVYIGGGVSLNGDFVFDQIRASVKEYLLMPELELPILPATFNDNASLIGAFSLVANKVVNFESLEV